MIFTAVMLFTGMAVSAQLYMLKGMVYDAHNHQSLSGVRIYHNQNLIAETSGDGRFQVPLKAGNYRLQAIHPDCAPQWREVQLHGNAAVTFYLEHHIKELEAVSLHGHRKPSGSSVQTLERKTAERQSSENLGNLLSNISGVNTLKTGNNIAKPVIHGFSGSRIAVLNNGVQMAEQEWGAEHAPGIDPNAFETLSVVKGAGTLRYGGDAAGGAVVLEPRQFAARDSLMGSITGTYNSNGRGGSLGADLAKTWQNRWYVHAQGAYKKLGDQSAPQFTLQNTGAEEHSFSFGTGYRGAEKGATFYFSGVSQDFGIFKGSHLGSAEDFLDALSQGKTFYSGNFSYKIENPRQEVSHHLAKVSAYRLFPRIGRVDVQYDFQINNRKEYDVRRGDYNALPSLDLQLMTHRLRIESTHEHEQWKLQSGLTGSFQDNYADPATKARRLIPDYYRYDAGAFSVLNYQFSTKWSAEGGVRYDYSRYDAHKYYDESEWNARFAPQFPEFFVKKSGSRVLAQPVLNYSNLSASLGFTFKNDGYQLKAGFSRSSRTPNPAELFADGLHHSAAVIERGNLAIRQEVIYQANADLRKSFDVLGGLQIEVNPYYLQSDSFVTQTPSEVQLTIRGVFPVWDYRQVKAEMYGLDADARLDFSKYIALRSQFSMVNGRDLTNREWLNMVPPPTFKNALEIALPQWSGLGITLENEYVFRQTHFPVRSIAVQVIENGENIQKDLDLSTPPPGYSLWNVHAGARIFKQTKIYAGISNLGNTRYRDYMNRLRYFTDSMGRNYYFTLHYQF